MGELWWRLLLLDPALEALRKPHCSLLTLLTKDQHLPDHWTNIKSNAEDVAGRKFAQAMLLQWLTIMYILYFSSNNHQLTRNMSCLVLTISQFIVLNIKHNLPNPMLYLVVDTGFDKRGGQRSCCETEDALLPLQSGKIGLKRNQGDEGKKSIKLGPSAI